MNDRQQQIGIVIRDFPLQHGGEALETQAGVDRRPRQWRQLTAGILVVLHEHQVPDLDVASAGVARKRLVLAARLGGFRPQIVMDFRARPARPGVAHLPEIVGFIQAENPFFGDAGHRLPQPLGFIVLTENRHVQAVLGQAVIFGDQIPGVLDSFGLEVIAE